RTAPSSSICPSALLLATAAAADDQLVGFLVLLPGALAERRYAPRSDRVTAALRLALAAAVRVVDGVHRGAADGRTLAEPAATTGLAARDVLVVRIAALPDRGAAGEQHAAQLSGREAQHGVRVVLGHELDSRAGAPGHLASAAGLELDVVDERAGRDARERQA